MVGWEWFPCPTEFLPPAEIGRRAFDNSVFVTTAPLAREVIRNALSGIMEAIQQKSRSFLRETGRANYFGVSPLRCSTISCSLFSKPSTRSRAGSNFQHIASTTK